MARRTPIIQRVAHDDPRHYPGWMSLWRVRGTTWRVANLLDPRCWAHIWTMWRGKRLWATRWYIRHAVIREG